MALDTRWLKILPIQILPEGTRLAIELGIPFTWNIVYFLVLFVALGSILFEIACPHIIKRELPRKPTQVLVKTEFRITALQYTSVRRMNHFMDVFLEDFANNYTDLHDPEPDNGELRPLPDKKSIEKLDTESVYRIAERMRLADSVLDEAIETIIWFANDTRAVVRWLIGGFFIIAIGLFGYIVWQGLMQIVR